MNLILGLHWDIFDDPELCLHITLLTFSGD